MKPKVFKGKLRKRGEGPKAEMNEWTVIRQGKVRGTLKVKLVKEMPVDFSDRLVLNQLGNMLRSYNVGNLWVIKKYKCPRGQTRLWIYMFNNGITAINDAIIVRPERYFEALNLVGCFKSEIFRPKGSKYEKVKIK